MTLGLYVHIPFCEHKCSYCNFASGEFSSLNRDDYIESLAKEFSACPQFQTLNKSVSTIFIGGGTPSYLTPSLLKKMIEKISKSVTNFVEWTVEMNPNSVTTEKLKILKEEGVTRISVGVQSFQQEELTFLERQHDESMACEALSKVETFFPGSWSADFIYGLPSQTMSSWNRTLEKALSMSPQHLSLYELTYEISTPLGQKLKQGQLQPMEEEMTLEMQQHAQKKLKASNLERYEISNYANEGKRCLHNDQIWEGGDFLAYGNGAHGRMKDLRFRNVSSPVDYVARMKGGVPVRASEEEDLTNADKLTTSLLLGLRRTEGLSKEQLKKALGKTSEEIWPALSSQNSHLSKFVDLKDGGIVCRGPGWNVLDRVVIELIDQAEI